jgi:glycosyltransferase involved in cell wall biosynthesis
MRILNEAIGMRARGHTILFAISPHALLTKKAREKGFHVEEIPLQLRNFYVSLYRLAKLIRKEKVDIVNTHSSSDAWLGGVAARMTGRKVIRTRHLSTPIRKGLNSIALYNWLSDYTVTTCKQVADKIVRQARLAQARCSSIPTGVDPQKLNVSEEDVKKFKNKWGLEPQDFVVGTTCVLRSWKGIPTLLKAAHELKDIPHLKWLIVGSGHAEAGLKKMTSELGLDKQVIFTGHLDNPYTAIAAMDIFSLLSTAHEGVSQSTLQAAYLKKPLITTTVGGLPEICLNDQTGFQIVGNTNSQDVSKYVMKLNKDTSLKQRMGQQAQDLVLSKFTFDKMLDQMEVVYKTVL